MPLERRQLTAHFNLAEFHCRDGTEVPESHEESLVRFCRYVLEPMRARYGAAKVHSGFRTAKHNHVVGGAQGSYHVYTVHLPTEVAADVSFATGTPWRWSIYAAYLIRRRYRRNGGIGLYSRGGWVHLDVRHGSSRWLGP